MRLGKNGEHAVGPVHDDPELYELLCCEIDLNGQPGFGNKGYAYVSLIAQGLGLISLFRAKCQNTDA